METIAPKNMFEKRLHKASLLEHNYNYVEYTFHLINEKNDYEKNT